MQKEQEAAKLQREYEKEKQDKERDEAEKQRQHEKEMAEMQLKLAQLKELRSKHELELLKEKNELLSKCDTQLLREIFAHGQEEEDYDTLNKKGV